MGEILKLINYNFQVHDIKKTFYKKFLYEPFPVESSLLDVLPDHFNAEIVAGTIKTKQDAIEYLTWTYLIQRLMKNPEYYGLHSLEESSINIFLSDLVEQCIGTLYSSYCVDIDEVLHSFIILKILSSFNYRSNFNLGSTKCKIYSLRPHSVLLLFTT